MGWGALKSKLHEHVLYAEQSKTTSTCNGCLFNLPSCKGRSRVVRGTRAFFNKLLYSGSMALPDQAQRSSQEPPRTEHYAYVAYRIFYFTSETSEKLFVSQRKTKKDKEKKNKNATRQTLQI